MLRAQLGKFLVYCGPNSLENICGYYVILCTINVNSMITRDVFIISRPSSFRIGVRIYSDPPGQFIQNNNDNSISGSCILLIFGGIIETTKSECIPYVRNIRISVHSLRFDKVYCASRDKFYVLRIGKITIAITVINERYRNSNRFRV